MSFDKFLAEVRPRLLAGLVASYGPEIGHEVTAEAMAYGWQNRERLQQISNPAGYLYRVGQSAARSHLRPNGYLPNEAAPDMPHFEPGLGPALETLTEQQRLCVVLVHALDWSQTEAAELLDVDISTVRTHLKRGLAKLRTALKVETNVG